MDRLDGEKIRVLAQNLGLARLPDEPLKQYRHRIQKAGILPTRGRLKEQNYLKARYDVLTTMEGASHPEDALALSSMVYGWGYAAERERINVAGGKDMGWKLQALDNAWVNMRPWVDPCRSQYRVLIASIAAGSYRPFPDQRSWRMAGRPYLPRLLWCIAAGICPISENRCRYWSRIVECG